MKNKEKFAKDLIDFCLNGDLFGSLDGKPVGCNTILCKNCDFVNDNCYENRKKWAEQEYIEPPKVDWSKVKVDTPIYVRVDEDDEWFPRHFAEYKDGKVFAWNNGKHLSQSLLKHMKV